MKNKLKVTVLDNDICCGCGACAGVCVREAIEINTKDSFKPVINFSKCNNCNLCFEVCPAKGYPINKWLSSLDNNHTKMTIDRGPVLQYYKGYSLDPFIRTNSASGGVATSLLINLLKNKMVDEVAVVGMSNEKPQLIITNDIKVIMSAMMSKYGPVPVLHKIIPELKNRPRKIALTLTPCQLAGLKLAISVVPKLKDSKIYTLGLFCGQIQTYDALRVVASSMKVKYPDEAKFIAWRYGAYPGSMRYEKKDGTFMDKPYYEWLNLVVPFYSLKRCFLCPDGGNWLADLTLGDIHRNGTDENIIVCRTKNGFEMLKSATEMSCIKIESLNEDEIERSVIKNITRSKLIPSLILIKWLKKLKFPAPEFDYNNKLLKDLKLIFLTPFYIIRFFMISIIRHKNIINNLEKYPFFMEKIGHFLYYFPSTIIGFKFFIKVIKKIHRFKDMFGMKRPQY